MPTFSIPIEAALSNFSISLTFLLLTLILKCTTSFSLPNTPLTQSHSNFHLLGDSHFMPGSSAVQLTNPNRSPSSGLLIWPEPVTFVSPRPVSFSTDFTFSISLHGGDGLAFVIVPTNFPSKFSRKGSFGLSKESRFFGVEFDTLVDGNVGDENDIHVGVDVNSLVSVKLSNVSKINLVLNSGIRLHSWIDYDATSKRLEVRLSKFGSARPYDPILVYQIDLGEMRKNEELLMGLSSSSGNSLQNVTVYSWNLRVRNVPKWLHSQPLNPQLFDNQSGQENEVEKKRSRLLVLLSGMILMTACGALTAFVVLYLWAIVARNRETAIPAKFEAHHGDFRYEKINVIVEDSLNGIKNPSIK